MTSPTVDEHINTVLIAIKPAESWSRPLLEGLEDARHLWVTEFLGLRICGVYMPMGSSKTPYWEAVIEAAGDIDLFVGDFNTGSNGMDKDIDGAKFSSAEFMDEVSKAGLVDVWRIRHPDKGEYSWFSNSGNGFRIDHAFASPGMNSRITSCEYDQSPRIEKLTDHAALLIELDD